jgi:hypothetical protein
VSESTSPSRAGKLIAAWGIAQVTLLLASSVYRLTPKALAPWHDGSLSNLQKILFFAWLVVNAYLEGYRGFQLRFCPRVVGRAKLLSETPTVLRTVLAAPFVLSMFDAPRRELIARYVFLTALITLIAAVRQLPQPWVGIVDGGVVVGLAWGMVMTVVYFVRFLSSGEVPEVVTRGRPATA